MIFTLSEALNFFFVFVRGGILFLGIPVFAGRVVPVRLRVAFAAIVAYLIAESLPSPFVFPDVVGIIIAMIAEALVGFLLVLGVRMLFFAVEFAGQLMAGEIGLAMTATLSPDVGAPASSVSQVLFYFTAVLFLITQTPQLILTTFAHSFSIMPAGASIVSHLSIWGLVKSSTNLFVLGLQMAAPIVAINFLVNIVFAILGKAVPRMNVFMTSFSVRIAAGLIVFLTTISLLTQSISEESRQTGKTMLLLLNP